MVFLVLIMRYWGKKLLRTGSTGFSTCAAQAEACGYDVAGRDARPYRFFMIFV
jgi:hypothetical protein